MSFITIPVLIEGAFYSNTAIGFNSLVNNNPAVFPNGQDNTAIGYLSLTGNTTGEGNTAAGSNSLALNTSGQFNTAIGERASYNNLTGQFNVSLGSTALNSNSASDFNVAIGYGAATSTTSASNTMIGAGAGEQVTSGAKNTILGRYNGNQGGLDIRTSSNYCVISDGDGNPRIIVDAAGLVSAPGGFSGGGGGGAITFNNQTAAYTVVSGDLGKIVNCTAGTFTVSLTAAATLGSGFNCWVWNTGTGVITIDPNGAETIDGVVTITLRKGEGLQIVCDGANWETGDKKTMRLYSENMASASPRPLSAGNLSFAIGLSASSGGEASVALGYSVNASAAVSSAIGQNSSYQGSQAVTGAGAMALGGSYASGLDSFAAAVANNTVTYGSQNANAIAIGSISRATGSSSVAIGRQNVATGTRSLALGNVSNASGTGSVAIGCGSTIGSGATASGNDAIAFGDSARALEIKKYAFAGWGIASAGSSQMGILLLCKTTTNDTATVLTSDTGVAATSNQVILSNSSAYAFTGTVVARQQAAGGTASAAWKIEGLIRREGTAGSTTLVASTVTAISNVPGWTLALSADTTNGGLAVTATGAAATNIRWVATVQTSEVIYA